MLLIWMMLFVSEPQTLPNTSVLFEEAVGALPQKQDQEWGDYVLAVGKTLMGKPYKEKLLEAEGPEHLVVRLDGYDCVTYVETVLALAHLGAQQGSDYSLFQKFLRDLRYRQGTIDGYGSRLHYTCDWRFDNAELGYLEDVTAQIGGEPYPKEVRFMSRNPQYYAALSDADQLAAIQAAETNINQRKHFYIPERKLKGLEHKIKDGDILALTTKVAYLDIAHLGFAIHVDGRLHLMHASSKYGKVVISPDPLSEELLASPSRHGIMVFRPLAK